jgi:hypothetical protein
MGGKQQGERQIHFEQNEQVWMQKSLKLMQKIGNLIKQKLE